MIAAIDAGSNAMRLAIASIQDDHQPMVRKCERAAWLGQDHQRRHHGGNRPTAIEALSDFVI